MFVSGTQIQLRPYQVTAFDALRANLRAGIKRQVLSLPTGGGKTVIASALIQAAMEKGSKVLFLADRQVLVEQASATLWKYGILHGVKMHGVRHGMGEDVIVGCAQSFEKQGSWPAVDLVIVDECHVMRKATSEYLMSSDIPVVGLTATPFTTGMGLLYQKVVTICTTNGLIKQGYLVPIDPFVGTPIEEGKLKLANGEWTKNSAADAAKAIIGDVLTDWLTVTKEKYGGPVKTICFSPTVQYGEDLVRRWNEAGYPFEQIFYLDKDKNERRAKIRALERGDIWGLVSAEALTRGFDVTDIQCVQMVRAYKSSLSQVAQSLGRGMRGHPGKTDCVLIDHVWNYPRFEAKLLEFWQSGWGELSRDEKKIADKTERIVDKERKCLGCGAFMPPRAKECPSCGRARPQKQESHEHRAGKMQRYESPFKEIGDVWPHICALAEQIRGHETEETRLRWARAQYKGVMGKWPRWDRQYEPGPTCDVAVCNAVRENMRKFRNKQRRRRAA